MAKNPRDVKGNVKGMDFRSPPDDAIRYLEQKFPQASWAYTDLLDDAHDRAFVVAKMMDVDLASTVQRSIIDAMQNGTGYKAWKKDIDKVLAKSGWYDGQINVDSQGNAVKITTGGTHRLETIYKTNVAAAYEAGRQKVIFNGRENDPFPFVKYSAIMDSRTRPTHRAMDGTVMKKSDPAWDAISPPNGYRCRCTIVELTQGQVDRYGYKVTESEGKVSTQVVELPNGKEAKRTIYDLGDGRVFKTDVGFNHAPKILPVQTLFDKALTAEPKLASKILNQTLSSPRVMKDVNQEFGKFAQPFFSTLEKTPKANIKKTGDYCHIGSLSDEVVTKLDEADIAIKSPVITLTDDVVIDFTKENMRTSGRTFAENILDMPNQLKKPLAVMLDDKADSVYSLLDSSNSYFTLATTNLSSGKTSVILIESDDLVNYERMKLLTGALPIE